MRGAALRETARMSRNTSADCWLSVLVTRQLVLCRLGGTGWKTEVFWDVTSCLLVGLCCLHLHAQAAAHEQFLKGLTLDTVGTGRFETSPARRATKWCHIPEDLCLHPNHADSCRCPAVCLLCIYSAAHTFGFAGSNMATKF